MSWGHESRALRAQVHSGLLTETEAAERLSVLSDGGLTVVGALGILRKPAQQVADEYQQIVEDALSGLDRIAATKARRHLSGSAEIAAIIEDQQLPH